MNLLIVVLLTAVLMGLGWAALAALGAVLRRLRVFPDVPPGPAAGHCPNCGHPLPRPAFGAM